MTQLVLPHTIDAGTEITAVEHQLNNVAIRDVINGGIEGGSGSSGNIKVNGVTAREVADNVLYRAGQLDSLQEGVVASGDGRVTPGAGLVLNYASGNCYILDDSAVIASGGLIPAVITGATATIAANASGNPRIDQIVATLTGWGTATVSVVQGTATAGATLANRTGAAALPAGAVRLADILMPNGFAGPFIQATHIRDRRPWSRGFQWTQALQTGPTYGTLVGFGTLVFQARMECSGVPVLAGLRAGYGRHEGAAGTFQGAINVTMDGVAQGLPGNVVLATNGLAGTLAAHAYVAAPSAGSHLFEVYLFGDALSVGLRSYQGFFEESMKQNGSNDGA